VAGYSGDAGDAMAGAQWNANGKVFSAFDNDNDDSADNCAVTHKGGWWCGDCTGGLSSQLNMKPDSLWSTESQPADVQVSRMLIRMNY